MTSPLSSPISKYSPSHTLGLSIGRVSRVLLVLWSLFLLGGFFLAWKLEPDPRGYGTHQGLGLPPCTFQQLYDVGCPSCGMTTSFAHFVRGHWIRACQANLGGFTLALACAAMIPWCWVSVYRGCLWGVVHPDWAMIWLLMLVMILALIQWGLKLWLQ